MRKPRGPNKTGRCTLSAQQRIEIDSIPEPNSGCWLWMNSGGRYGQVMFKRRLMQAHRLSWIAFRGEIPAGANVLHVCDTPGCVNPDHLFIGTQADNVRDMRQKGRAPVTPRGEAHFASNLTEESVRTIRLSTKTTQELARELGLDWSTIDSARRGKTWGHIQ